MPGNKYEYVASMCVICITKERKPEYQEHYAPVMFDVLQMIKFNEVYLTVPSFISIDHNFEARLTYGNRQEKGIKICQWNAALVTDFSPISRTKYVISYRSTSLLYLE